MTNKDQDTNIYLSYDKYDNNINEYHWKNIGAFNEYIDLSITDPFFVQKSLNELDGDYYLAIQGKDDTFDNLYISSQDIKIITLDENHPVGCICESENDNCYQKNYDVKNENNYQFLYMALNEENPKFAYDSVIVVIQCK